MAVIAIVCLCLATATEGNALTLQRAQMSIYIQVTVIPGPLGSITGSHQVAFNFRAPHEGKGSARSFDATPLAGMVAANQGSVPVQANVMANPTGNLLVGAPNSISVTQGRATTQIYTCAFTVAVTTSVSSWSLQTGLSNDFDPNFPGNTLAYSMYIGAPPAPQTFTKYVVYPNNNNTWALATTNGQSKSYCVDLQLNIPLSVPLGTYSTNAVYTLFY